MVSEVVSISCRLRLGLWLSVSRPLSVVSVCPVGISVVSTIVSTAISISNTMSVISVPSISIGFGIWLSYWLGVSRSLLLSVVSVCPVGISVISTIVSTAISISKTMSVISVPSISISFSIWLSCWLSISRPLSVVSVCPIGISVSIVSTISISMTISVPSISIGFSIWGSFRLSYCVGSKNSQC